MTTSSTNYTGLYSGNVSGAVPNTAYGNANVVSLLAAGTDGANTVANVVATGNITGNYFLGNGSQLTGIAASYGNANVTTLLAAFGSNTISTTGTVTAGNVTGGNLLTGGVVSATGNVAGNYFLGNGSQLTGIAASYGNANVTTLLAAFGSNTVSTTGNVTAGNILTPGVISATGNITTSGYFIGTFAGNISGNLTVPGSNTQVLYNNTGNAGASAGFTFDQASNVATVSGNIVGGNITTAGNVTGNFILGNGSQLTGLPATYGNANVVANLAALGTNPVSTTGNVSAGYFLGNGSQLTGLPATYGNANVVSLLAAFGSNAISTTGNVTAGYVVGNGSLLTNLTGGNVTGSVAQANTANTANSVAGANVTGQVANALIAGTVYTNAQPNITSVGTLTSATVTGNITGGNILTGGIVSATGDITSGSGVFYGNGAGLTNINAGNIAGSYGNANVAANLAAFANNPISTTGNITAGNVATTVVQATSSAGLSLKNSGGTTQASMGAGGGDNFAIAVSTNINGANAQIDISPTGNSGHVHIKPTGTPSVEIAPTYPGSINNMVIGNITPVAVNATTVSATGNITASYFIGNGSLLSSITGANVTGTVANATFATSAGSATTATTAATVTDAAQPNITSVGTLTSITSTGNVTGGNVLTGGVVSATGNITGNYFIGNGSQLTGIIGSYGNANVADFLANGFGSNAITTTGNITAGNVIGGNVIGGNIAISGNLILNINTANANVIPTPNRILMGNGYNSDYSGTYDPLVVTRGGVLQIINKVAVSNTQVNLGMRQFTSTQFADLSGQTYSSTGYRISGGGTFNFIGNGTYTATGGQWASLTGGSMLVAVGNFGNVTLGNATVSHAVGAAQAVFAGTGGNIGNAVAVAASINIFSATGNVTSGIAYATQLLNVANLVTTPTTAIGFLHPGNTNVYGQSTGNGWRSATNYYAFKNDDSAAQMQLGSLRAYHEFQAAGNTTGTWNIDKSAGQVQAVSPTGNITIGSYTNFVTTANDGTNNDSQTDTVTLIIEQGATPYSVTMPTGNAAIRYAGNVTTVASTANTTIMVAITAYRTAANATGYLTTISPGFV